MVTSIAPRFGNVYIQNPKSGDQWRQVKPLTAPKTQPPTMTNSELEAALLRGKGPRLQLNISADSFQIKGEGPVPVTQNLLILIVTDQDARMVQEKVLDRKSVNDTRRFVGLFPPVLKDLLQDSPLKIDNPGFLQARLLEQDELLPQKAIKRY